VTKKKKTPVPKKRGTATAKGHSTRKPKPAPYNPLRDLGVMRIVLAIMTIISLLGAPEPGTQVVLSGWEMWPTLIVPVLAPILFMVLMLDALMGRVMMASVEGAARDRYRRIVVLNLVLGVVLAVYWAPYFMAIGKG
jgi:hypothetical protein